MVQPYLDVLSSTAPVVLVIITGYYAYETSKMRRQQEKRRLHQWYEDTTSVARKMKEEWNRAFSMPDGADDEVYVRIRHMSGERTSKTNRTRFAMQFDEFTQELLEQYSRRPDDVNEHVGEQCAKIHRKWQSDFVLQLGSGKIYADNEIKEEIDELEEMIAQESERFGVAS